MKLIMFDWLNMITYTYICIYTMCKWSLLHASPPSTHSQWLIMGRGCARGKPCQPLLDIPGIDDPGLTPGCSSQTDIKSGSIKGRPASVQTKANGTLCLQENHFRTIRLLGCENQFGTRARKETVINNKSTTFHLLGLLGLKLWH